MEALDPTEDIVLEVFDPFRLDGGRAINGGRWITATSRARTLIFLWHRGVERRLLGELIGEDVSDVRLETQVGDRLIDAVATESSQSKYRTKCRY